ncbi:hypothetical protein RFI02_02910 [Acinetobacter sichuanensis]|uniref:MCR_0457 family protein n=1 Tax=Acinetobacter sichuanensis TaxID=2136183 RepID=UPI00280CD1D6|nr:hypothetical protein [Acinetobacter sichuanensis]MDQ9020052.1 hypothetical protein [Acinetobacter sichuanensis]
MLFYLNPTSSIHFLYFIFIEYVYSSQIIKLTRLIMRTLFKTFALGILSTSIAMPYAFAADQTKEDAHDEKIEVTQVNVTDQELAAIYVLSDICPKLVKDKDAFDAGYQRLLKDFIPDAADPEATIKKLVKEKSFKSILKEAQGDAKKAGKEANTGVCEDVLNYQPQN